MSASSGPKGPDPERIETLFARGLELPTAERAAFLEHECGDDAALRAEVASLLAAHGEAAASDVLDPAGAAALVAAEIGTGPTSATPHPHSSVRAGPEADPSTVGPFRLLRPLGQGGMGTVYLAERITGGFEQRVALKLVKRGMDSDSILARFRQERQILARLEHPGIARLVDGGVTADGRPYFAMEHVEGGEPVTDAADRLGLGIEDRLRRFLDICAAVTEAHRNLVVHCDLKPSNILVTAEGKVKLVDFGIARLLESDQEQVTTRFGLRALTPAYAAPEQLAYERATTSADVYSLGVVLYELLSGSLPHPGPFASPLDLERAVRETEPPTASAAARREARGEAWVRRLDGDVDAILSKALAVERERRYASVEALAADVRRHLDGLPVEARPPGGLYRARKFVRRHRLGVALAGATFLALLLGLVGTAWQARVAAGERDRAEAQATKAEAVQEFLATLLVSIDPNSTGGAPWTADQLLDAGQEQLERRTLPPEVEADLLVVLADVSTSLGQLERAETLRRRVLSLRTAGVGEPLDLAEAILGLGRVRYLRDDLDESSALYERALATIHLVPPTPSSELVRAMILQQMGTGLHELGELAAARSRYEAALEILKTLPSDHRPAIAELLLNLGSLARLGGELDRAEILCREALQLERESLPPGSPTLAGTLSILGITLRDRGEAVEAEELLREALAITRGAFGDRHPGVATHLNNLAVTLRHRGAYEEAAALFRQVLDLDLELLGEDHAWVAYSRDNLGSVLAELGEIDEAAEHIGRALPLLVSNRGPRSVPVATNTRHRARILALRGRDAEALGLYEEALSIYRENLPPGSGEELGVLVDLGDLADRLGEREQAEALYREGLGLLESVDQARPAPEVALRCRLGRLELQSGRTREAVALLGAARDLAARSLPLGNQARDEAEAAWIVALWKTGSAAEAQALGEAFLERARPLPGVSRRGLVTAVAELVER